MNLSRLAALSLLCTSLTVAPAAWSASAATAPSLKKVRADIARISHGRAEAEKVFAGPSGLTGVLIKIQGRRMVGWLTSDGRHLLIGSLIGPEGANETRAAMEKLGLIPKPIPAEKFAVASTRAAGFTVGTKGPLLTAYIDPNCIYCHKFYQEVMPLVNAGRVRVRFVPVAFLKPSSPAKAVALLAAADPAAALAKNEKDFDTSTEEGGIAPAKDPDPAVAAKVKANTELLAKSGQVATPTLVYCSRKGSPVLLQGLPPDAMTQMTKTIAPFRGGHCAAGG